MDNAGSTATPAYPHQYDDRHFYDKPAGPLPNGSFSAVALLTKLDLTARKITAYEGVSYGFVLSADLAPAPVPEPAAVWMMLFGLATLMFFRRRYRFEG